MVIDSMVASAQLEEELRQKVREAMLKRHHHQNEKKLSNRIPLVRSFADIGKKQSDPHLLERNCEGPRCTSPFSSSALHPLISALLQNKGLFTPFLVVFWQIECMYYAHVVLWSGLGLSKRCQLAEVSEWQDDGQDLIGAWAFYWHVIFPSWLFLNTAVISLRVCFVCWIVFSPGKMVLWLGFCVEML